MINNALNLTEAGLILILVAQETKKAISSWYFKLGWLATGYLVAFQFLNKAPSSVMFVALLTVFLFLYQKDTNWRYYLTCGSCFVTGGILGLLTYFIFVQDFWEYQELLFRQLSLLTQNNVDTNSNLEAGYSVGESIRSSANTARSLSKEERIFIVVKGAIELILFYIATFVTTRIYFTFHTWQPSKQAKLRKGLLWLFFISAITLIIPPTRAIIIRSLSMTLYLIKVINTIAYPLVFIFLLIIIVAAYKINLLKFIPSHKQHYFINNIRLRKTFAVSIFLFILPYCAAFGTDTSITVLAARNIIPWLTLIVILLTPLYQTNKAHKFLQLFVLTIILGLGIRIYHAQIYTPFRLLENRLHQTETLDFVQPRARGLKVDPLTAEFYKKLDQIVAKTDFQLGDPIIALDNTPGLVYLLGGVSPGAPWYFSDSDGRTCNNILYSSFDSSKAILLISADISPQVLGCLKTVGINFPENYQKVGELNNPWFIIHPIQGKTVAVWSSKK